MMIARLLIQRSFLDVVSLRHGDLSSKNAIVVKIAKNMDFTITESVENQFSY